MVLYVSLSDGYRFSMWGLLFGLIGYSRLDSMDCHDGCVGYGCNPTTGTDLDVRFGFGEFRAICDDLRW